MLTKVAVLAYDGIAPFELGVAVRGVRGGPVRRRPAGAGLRRVRPAAGDYRTSAGFSITVEHGPVPARRGATWSASRPSTVTVAIPPEVARGAQEPRTTRGARVMSVCSGRLRARRGRPARRPGVHHALASHRRAGRPASRGREWCRRCSTSTRPGAHQCGHGGGHRRLAATCGAQEYGAAMAGQVARRMVVPPAARGRPGAVHPAHRCPAADEAETLGPLLTWLDEHLGE